MLLTAAQIKFRVTKNTYVYAAIREPHQQGGGHNSSGSLLGGGGTPIVDLTKMLVVTLNLGVEVVDPVTLRMSGRKR